MILESRTKDFLVMRNSETELKICFVLPTKNEMNTVGPLIHSLKKLTEENRWTAHIIVTDDSTDATRKFAQEAGAEVVSGGDIGLGAAVIVGIRKAVEKNPHWVITLDSDGQVDINEIPKFLDVAKKERADMVTSSRFLGKENFDYRYPWLNWVGNRILVTILFFSSGKCFSDSHGGIRIIKKELAEKFYLLGKHTYVQETLILASKDGAKIIELPSRWKVREHGKSRVLSSIFRYMYRTSPALAFHMNLHFGFAGLSLWFFYQSQKGINSWTGIVAVLCALISVGVAAQYPFRMRVK